MLDDLDDPEPRWRCYWLPRSKLDPFVQMRFNLTVRLLIERAAVAMHDRYGRGRWLEAESLFREIESYLALRPFDQWGHVASWAAGVVEEELRVARPDFSPRLELAVEIAQSLFPGFGERPLREEIAALRDWPYPLSK